MRWHEIIQYLDITSHASLGDIYKIIHRPLGRILKHLLQTNLFNNRCVKMIWY